MLRADCITLIASRLGNRTDLNDTIALEMLMVQETLLEGTGAFLPWFLVTELVDLPVTAGEERVNLPAVFLGEVEGQPLWWYDANLANPYKRLHKNDLGLLMEKYIANAVPVEYALSGNYIILKPTPSVNGTLRLRYYAAAVKDETENGWLKYAPDLLIAETGAVIAGKYLQNTGLADRFIQDGVIARQRLFAKNEARQHTNRQYGMGED